MQRLTMLRTSSSIASIMLMVMVFTLSAIVGARVKGDATQAEAQASLERKPQLVVQLGHTGVVKSVALSVDGKYLMTGSEDRSAKLWEVASGRLIRGFEGHLDHINSIALSSDGKYLVTGSDDATAKLWEIETGKEIRTFTGHTYIVSSVALSTDGHYLVTGSWDGTAKLWEVASGREIRSFRGHTVTCVALSKDGKYLATGSSDKTAKLWDVESGTAIRTFAGINIFTGHSDEVTSVAFSPDGKHLVTGSKDETAKLWEIASAKEIRTFKGDSGVIRAVAFSPDGKYLVTGGGNNIAMQWEVETGKEIRTFIGHDNWLNAVAVSADGKYLVTGSEDHTAKLWEIDSGKEIRAFTGYSDAVYSVALSDHGKYMVTGSWDTGKVWEIASGREIRTFTGHYDRVNRERAVAVSGDGKYLVTRTQDKTAKLWEFASDKEIRTFTGDFLDLSLAAMSGNGKYLVIGSLDGTAKLWEVASGREIRRFQNHHTGGMSCVALSADGRYLVTGSEDHTAKLLEVASGRVIHTFQHSFGVNSLALSADGKYLVTVGWDIAKLWEVASGKEIRTFQHHDYATYEVRAVAFSADGKYIVTGSEDRTAKVWEVESGKEIRTFTGHSDSVTSVVLSTDGKYLVTGSDDSTTRIWNMEDGKELCQLISFDDGNWAVVDPAGHFDVSNLEEIKGFFWVMPDDPMRPLPLEIFMRDYYEPRLLPRLLNGEKFKQIRPLSELNRVQPPVKIAGIERQKDNPDLVTVTVEVAKAKSERQRDQQGNLRETDVYDLRLFRDGQIVGEFADGKPVISGTNNELFSWRNEMRVNLEPTGKRTIKFENIRLPRKADLKRVEFSAYAFNEDRVKSQTDRKTFDIPAELTPRKGRAYVISVGVNAYENSAFDLRYSVNDARAIQQTMFDRLSKIGDYDQVVQVPLISDYSVDHAGKIIPSHEATKEDLAAGRKIVISKSATKSNLKAVIDVLAGKSKAADLPNTVPNAAELRKQLQQAQPEDLVLISFSSHGYANASGHFFFVLSDTGPGTGEEISEALLQRLSSRFLSSVELSLWLRDVDAGEMLMIVDACHSAAAVEGQEFKPGPMGSRGLGQLSYDKGMRILTATQSTDVAYGLGALKQGLLTYVLVKDGIEAGKADFKPIDKRITVSEWLEYGEQGVPKLLEQATNQAKSQSAPVEIKELVQKTAQDIKTQRPSLFDFARKRADVVLVRQ